VLRAIAISPAIAAEGTWPATARPSPHTTVHGGMSPCGVWVNPILYGPGGIVAWLSSSPSMAAARSVICTASRSVPRRVLIPATI
jgi:hypothetical protein